jgi:hypothetical protein
MHAAQRQIADRSHSEMLFACAPQRSLRHAGWDARLRIPEIARRVHCDGCGPSRWGRPRRSIRIRADRSRYAHYSTPLQVSARKFAVPVKPKQSYVGELVMTAQAKT